MSREYCLFHEVCVRCENYIDGQSCNSKDECPAYNLYQIAKGIKPKIIWCNGFPVAEEEKKAALDWIEITLDNIEEVYSNRHNLVIMNPKEWAYTQTYHSANKKVLKMYAYKGGYYYHVLPELANV